MSLDIEQIKKGGANDAIRKAMVVRMHSIETKCDEAVRNSFNTFLEVALEIRRNINEAETLYAEISK